MLLLGDMQFTASQIVLLLIVAVLLMVVMVVAGLGLPICYYRSWNTWPAWLLLLGLLLASMSGIHLFSDTGSGSLAGIANLLFIGAGTALLTAISIWLWQHDAGLALLAGFSLIWTWGERLVAGTR